MTKKSVRKPDPSLKTKRVSVGHEMPHIGHWTSKFMPATPDDLEMITAARPYIRSVLAFLVYLRWGEENVFCYGQADQFIDQLKRDMEQ